VGSPANWAPLGLGETVVADITVAAGGHSASAGEEGRREEAPDAHGTVGHGGEKTRVEKQEGVKGKKVLWGGFQPFFPFFFKIRSQCSRTRHCSGGLVPCSPPVSQGCGTSLGISGGKNVFLERNL